MSLTVTMDTAKLAAIMVDIQSEIDDAVRPAAQAAAQVLVDEVRSNVAKIGRKTGNLAASIYQVYSKSKSNKQRAVYHVSWNARTAPHGHLVEFGHMQRYRTVLTSKGTWITLKQYPLATPRQVAARPFVRPAQAKFGAAEDAAIAKLLQLVGEAQA